MKKIYNLLLLTLISFVANAQTVSIESGFGGGTGTSGLVVVGPSNYNFSEHIYTSTELGSNFTAAANNIKRIAISVNTLGDPTSIPSFRIRMKNVAGTITALTAGNYSSTGYTTVFNGTINPTSTGWYVINLATSFTRIAGNSLQVMFERTDNAIHSGFVFDAAVGNNLSASAIVTKRYYGTTNFTTATVATTSAFRPMIRFINPPANDASIIGFINPTVSCYNSPQSIGVVVNNEGTSTIAVGAASVNLKIRGANTFTGTLTNTAAIAAGTSGTVTFTGISLNNVGSTVDTAVVTLTGDTTSSNNIGTSSITTATTLSSLPQTEDAEGNFNVFAYLKGVVGANAWTVLSFISNTGAFNNGYSFDSLTPRPGGGSDYFLFDSWDAAPGTISRLYSNCVDIPATGTSRVSFWMSHDSAFATDLDSLYVVVSANKGVTWTRVGGFQRPDDALLEYTWLQDSVDISSYNGQTIQVGFEGVGAYGNAIGLDDINIYNVSAACLPILTSTTTSSCNSYTWPLNSVTYTASGTYIRNYNAPCGAASADTLKLTITRGTFAAVTRTACGSYLWSANGLTYTTSGNYVRTYTNTDGCASADTLHLTINQGTFTSTPVSRCGSYTWPANGNTYTATGTYIRNYTNGSLCPSADTLKLTITPAVNNSTSVSVCSTYTWATNATTYTTSGNYTYNNVACSTTDTLHLTIKQPTSSSSSQSACTSYAWHGTTYTTSGAKTWTGTNAAGCDSVVTLNLTIKQATSSTASPVSACGTYTWNATTYTTSGVKTFTTTNAASCDSVVTLNLTIKQATSSTASPASGCGSYTWHGTTYTTSGTKTWTGTNAAGCDSVVSITITINPITNTGVSQSACGSYSWNGTTYTASGNYTHANGTCSTDTLYLTIKQPTSSTDAPASGCGSYSWHGTTYTTSGTKTWTGTNAAGCDSVVSIVLTINPIANTGVTRSGCVSYTWSANGQTYSTGGTYTNANGCSTDTLHLTINQPTSSSSSYSACTSYQWHGVTYTTSGAKTWTGTNAAGCDSVVTLNLTIKQPTSSTDAPASGCGSYSWHGTTYTTSGTKTWTGTNAAGCDSVVSIIITINPIANTAITRSACVSYTWTANSQTYSTGGTYTNANGCSTDTLHLTINQPSSSSSSYSACTSYAWHGTTYTTSGAKTWTGQNAAGCDSVVTLNLTINQPTSSTDAPASECSSYSWHGTTFTTSGTKTWTGTNAAGCDSVVTIAITIKQPTSSTETPFIACGSYLWHGTTYNTSGMKTWTGTNAAGCDSTVTLNLTVNENKDSIYTISSPGSYTWSVNGIIYSTSGTYSDNSCGNKTLKLTIISDVVVYPNPTNDGKVTINWANANITLGTRVSVTVYDRVGRVVSKLPNFLASSEVVDLLIKSYSNGLYFIKIQTAVGESATYSTKIIKGGN